jgi:hypothetical protein
MDELYDDLEFHVLFPVRFLVRKDSVEIPDEHLEPIILENAVLKGAQIGSGPSRALTLFTDPDLAEQYVEENKVRDALIAGSDTPQHLSAVLGMAAKQGFTHVCFDPDTTGRKVKWVTTIERVLERIQDDQEE